MLAGEAPRAANGQRTITPDEILDMHVAHFRDVRRFAQAQYQQRLRQHQGRLAAILRVQSRAPNGAASPLRGRAVVSEDVKVP